MCMPQQIGTNQCDFCHESIFCGEQYAEDNGLLMCQECLDNMKIELILKAFGIPVLIAT